MTKNWKRELSGKRQEHFPAPRLPQRAERLEFDVDYWESRAYDLAFVVLATMKCHIFSDIRKNEESYADPGFRKNG